MAERLYRLKRLARKNYNVQVKGLDSERWRLALQADPQLPRNLGQLRQLWRDLTEHRRRRAPAFDVQVTRGVLRRRIEECGEAAVARFFTALGSPLLGNRDLDEIDAMMDADLPAFDQSLETDHFVLRWTNSAAHAADNLADAAIVDETAGYLETAWAQYNSVFGRAPYPPAGGTKIDVNFWDIGGYGVASPPDGPISFDAENWQSQPGIRQPTSAHELFHKLQYAFGYRTLWAPVAPYQWFSEGSASWAEVYVWQRVSGAYKMTDLFTTPDLDLYNASYRALPFWMFFDTRQRDAVDDIPLVGYLQRYELTGQEETALGEAIDADWPANNVYGQLDTFFALFSRERRIGAWRQTPTGGQPYATILGPDGAAITPALATTDVPLASGDVYSNAGNVSGLGSDYYHFVFDPNADAQTLTISVTAAAGGDYSYYSIWEKGGAFKKATFPFVATGSFTFSQPLEIATADALVFIISGRGTGGGYTIDASIT
jgi:hypothetical protein